jgi:hypothetical protein
MRAYGRAKPRNPARYIAIKEGTRCFYFEISSTGGFIPPPELVDENAPFPLAQARLPASAAPPNSKNRPGWEFVGFFDENKIKEPIVPQMRLPVPGYSIQDLLAGPVVR